MKFKRKKLVRMRGSKTHGWGAMKKHRGAGNRGGRGNAGSGKRGDARKPSFLWNNPDYFGQNGFTSNTPKLVVCNVRYLENSYRTLLSLGKITEEKGTYVVDLKALGYDKLLAKGDVVHKFKITVPYASSRVIEQVKAKGGEVILTAAAKEKTVKEE